MKNPILSKKCSYMAILRDRCGVIAWRGLWEGPEQVFKSGKQAQS